MHTAKTLTQHTHWHEESITARVWSTHKTARVSKYEKRTINYTTDVMLNCWSCQTPQTWWGITPQTWCDRSGLHETHFHRFHSHTWMNEVLGSCQTPQTCFCHWLEVGHEICVTRCKPDMDSEWTMQWLTLYHWLQLWNWPIQKSDCLSFMGSAAEAVAFK